MIIFGKLTKKIYTSDDGFFHVYSFRQTGGKVSRAIYKGEDFPKPLKSVDYQLIAEWDTTPKYGKGLLIESYERSDLRKNNDYSDAATAAKAIG